VFHVNLSLIHPPSEEGKVHTKISNCSSFTGAQNNWEIVQGVSNAPSLHVDRSRPYDTEMDLGIRYIYVSLHETWGLLGGTSNVLFDDGAEGFTLAGGDVELLRVRLTTSVSASNGAGAPCRSTHNLTVITQVRISVSKGHENEPMMGKERQGC